jgi:hypothetical protein
MDPRKQAKRVAEAATKVAAAIESLAEPPVPGAPGPEPSSLEEPTSPREPLPPKPDQEAPETRTPTGAETGAPAEAAGQQDAFLTTATGVRVADTDHSLKAGERGPTLLQDHHLREEVNAKAGAGAPAGVLDPRVALMVDEAFRHGKPIGAWGAGSEALASCAVTGAGVATGDDVSQVVDETLASLAHHRVWERFATAGANIA